MILNYHNTLNYYHNQIIVNKSKLKYISDFVKHLLKNSRILLHLIFVRDILIN